MSSSSASRRLALLALAAVVTAVPAGTLGRTAAVFSGEAATTAVVTTVGACVGDPATYTSGMLDAAGPLLRWSFSGAPAPDGDPASGTGPAGTSPTGLLVCDPVDLAAGGDAGPAAVRSLDLAGGAGGGLTSAPLATAGTASLLLWVRVEPGAADGEIASLGVPADVVAAPETPAGEPSADPVPAPTPTDPAPADPAPGGATTGDPSGTGGGAPPDGLVLSVVGDTLQLTEQHGGTTTVLAATPFTRGASRLVTVVLGAGADTTTRATLAAGDGPATAPAPLARTLTDVTLTVGARPSATAAVARVDEVTVVPTALTDADRQGLLAADRWWSAAG